MFLSMSSAFFFFFFFLFLKLFCFFFFPLFRFFFFFFLFDLEDVVFRLNNFQSFFFRCQSVQDFDVITFVIIM